MNSTGNDYVKPYAKEIFGVVNKGYYPYSREELVKQPIFPYFVLDGGAFNFMNDNFGTADGDDILELTLSGKLFDVFKLNGKFNWESSFSFVENTEIKKMYEWQIWPQRLYFTIPLAHKYLQTNEKRYADAWLKIVKEWDKAHPYQEFDDKIHYLETDMVWRDMQVAWRTMSLLHGFFMLQDAPFTIDEWKYLYDFIELHMNHLYLEAMERLSRNHAQNHVLQIGVVLLLAVSMFPEFKNTDILKEIAINTVEMNLRKAIFDDGGSDEDSPSYSHFIARLYLEAFLIIDKNGYREIKGLKESVVKQYEWLYQCMTPLGTTLRLSDSYSFDVLKDLDYVSRLIDLDFNKVQKEIYYPESHIAVFRKNKMTVFVDAAKFPGPHHHTGSPQIISYFDSEPVLVDAGVCNYDRWELYNSLRLPKSHNVLYCEEFNDNHENLVVEPIIKSVDMKNGTITVETTVKNTKSGIFYIWERTISVSENKIIIEDNAKSEKELTWKSRLIFKRNPVSLVSDNEMQILNKKFHMILKSDNIIKNDLIPVMNDANKIDYAVVCESEKHGKEYKNKIELNFINR